MYLDATGYAAANIEAASIYGTIATVAQGSITSLGTLTALQVDQININGNSITSTDSNGAIYIAPNGTGTANVADKWKTGTYFRFSGTYTV